MSHDPQPTPQASGSGCGMLAAKYAATVLGCCACSVAATLVVITGVVGWSSQYPDGLYALRIGVCWSSPTSAVAGVASLAGSTSTWLRRATVAAGLVSAISGAAVYLWCVAMASC